MLSCGWRKRVGWILPKKKVQFALRRSSVIQRQRGGRAHVMHICHIFVIKPVDALDCVQGIFVGTISVLSVSKGRKDVGISRTERSRFPQLRLRRCKIVHRQSQPSKVQKCPRKLVIQLRRGFKLTLCANAVTLIEIGKSEIDVCEDESGIGRERPCRY